jgi:hypothetical protein
MFVDFRSGENLMPVGITVSQWTDEAGLRRNDSLLPETSSVSIEQSSVRICELSVAEDCKSL